MHWLVVKISKIIKYKVQHFFIENFSLIFFIWFKAFVQKIESERIIEQNHKK